MRGWVASVVLLAGCSVDDLTFSPVFDNPPTTDDAYAYNGIDSITISIANEGEDTNLVSTRFERGQPIQLTDVPFGDHLVMHAVGARGATASAYGRTCAFALSPDGEAPTPHAFFSVTQKFAATDLAPLPRTNGRVVAYQGTALFLGGIATVEQFDPRTGALEELGANLAATPRVNAADALIGLDPPRVVLVGGTNAGEPAGSIELFDPISGREQLDTDQIPLVGMTATSLADGSVVVVGGNAPGGSRAAVASVVEISNSANGVLVRNRATMQFARTGHTATALGTSIGSPVLIAGGTDTEGSGNAIHAAELYKPLQHVLLTPFNAEMIHPRTQHHAVLMPDGSVLFIGGLDSERKPVRAVERFTLEAGFAEAKDFSNNELLLPADVGVINNTVTLLPDGRVLIAGGNIDADPLNNAVKTAAFLQLDSLLGRIDFARAQELQLARTGHQATLLCDGTVLITFSNSAPERYNPIAAGRR